MEEAIKYFVGTHDFRAFVTENSIKDNCIRTITEASIKKMITIKMKLYLPLWVTVF